VNSQVIADIISEAINQLTVLVKRWPQLESEERESCLEALYRLEEAWTAMQDGIQSGALVGSVAALSVELSTARALREALAASPTDVSSEAVVIQLSEQCLRDLEGRLRSSRPVAG
jgi:hypothetical protein